MTCLLRLHLDPPLLTVWFFITSSTAHNNSQFEDESKRVTFSSDGHYPLSDKHKFVGVHPNRRIRNFRVRMIFRDNRVCRLPIFQS